MTMLEITTLSEGELHESSASAESPVSWSAVVAGAIVAVASSLVLLLLGSGLGLSMVSPWLFNGVSAATFAVSTSIWLIVIQWLSSALGGYLTGRLRTKWAGFHPDEVFFLDTAHGLLAWALATIIVAGVLSSAATTIAKGGAGAAIASSGMNAETAAQTSPAFATGKSNQSIGYYVDLMFRPAGDQALASNVPAAGQIGAGSRAEVTRILMMTPNNEPISAADRSYLAQLVAARTGQPSIDAQQRVASVIGKMDQAREKDKEVLEKARKAGITTSLLTVLALIVGAFISSAAAAFGGHVRSET